MNVEYTIKCEHGESGGVCKTHPEFVIRLLVIIASFCEDAVITASCGGRTFTLGPSVDTPECDELEAMLAFFTEVDAIEAQPQN